MIKMENKIENI